MLAERLTAPMDARAFIEVHQTEIWRYLRYLGCEAAEAEDLTQETFLIALSGAESSRTPAYLRTVARNLFFKSKRHSLAFLADVEECERTWIGFSRDDGGSSHLEALRGCLESLEGRAKQAIQLRYESRLSHAAMANSLELGEEGVKTLLRRVKERLRDCVQRKLET
ncbi:MAG TPA: sigma-70 family RNA polymerase sigma factor [Planctomycetota bacterium]|jgi:RNA polymerase sigma-70 factor (ECF subfamily)|nr:sigma-70 family RNA polymerase sigma factor [Planctomycetota bacterium]